MYNLTSGELHTIIEEQVINPNINNEIEDLLKSRNKWRKVANISETLGNLSIAAAAMLSFASGVYKYNDSLAFASGCVNVVSISLLKFSSYSAGESVERNKLLNELLLRTNVQPMPPPVYTLSSNFNQTTNHTPAQTRSQSPITFI